METTTKSAAAARRRSGTLDALTQLAGLAAVCGFVVYGWHLYTEANVREADTWLEEASAIRDPWQRHQKLWHGHALHTDDQRKRAEALLHASLEQALNEHSESALEFVDNRESSDSDELFDRYPRDPEQRAAQTASLRLVWPQLGSMRVFDRAALIRMAERCHLHEAVAPVERQTVLDCLRFGAQSRRTQSVLERLMDSAALGHSLTNAP